MKSGRMDKSVVVALVILIALRVMFALPLDNSLPGGTDASSHLFRSLQVLSGVGQWSYGWYGGFWFYGYPPLFYFAIAAVAQVIGLTIAYKLLANLLFVFLPLVFYLLVKEFNLPEKYALFSTAVFSLMPFSSYYLYDGRLPSLLALFVGLLFWKFQLRYLRTGSVSAFVLSVALLSVSILSHHLTAALLFFVASVWAFAEKGKTILRPFLLVGMAAFALSAWWIAPFLVETSGNPYGTDLVAVPASVNVISNIISSSYASDFFSSPLSPVFLVMLEVFTVLVTLSAVWFSFKGRPLKGMLIAVFALAVLSLVMSFKRALIVAPVPLSILVVLTVKEFGRFRKPLVGLTLAVFFLGFVSLYPAAFVPPALPAVEDRVLYLPVGNAVGGTYYETFLPALSGNENILGWYPQAESAPKIKYDGLLARPLDSTPQNYLSYLRAGAVNSVVVNANQSDIVRYFSESSLYYEKTYDSFVVFSPKERFSYIEVDGKYADANVSKSTDHITVSFNCMPGRVSVKESFDDRWRATLNGADITLEPDEYGFSSFESNTSGKCVLEMSFSDPPYALFFDALSLFSLAALVVFVARKIMIMPKPACERK